MNRQIFPNYFNHSFTTGKIFLAYCKKGKQTSHAIGKKCRDALTFPLKLTIRLLLPPHSPENLSGHMPRRGQSFMQTLAQQLSDIEPMTIYGRVSGVRGLMVEVSGPVHAMSVGARVTVETSPTLAIPCEVVGFERDSALLMPFGNLEGVRRGCRAVVAQSAPHRAPLHRLARAGGECAWRAH